MNIEMEGTLKYVSQLQGANTKYPKKTINLEVQDGEYTNVFSIEASGKTLDILDNFSKGQKVKVQINLRGREYTDKNTGELKCFNSLSAWRIEAVGGNKQQAKRNFPEPQNDDVPF